MSTNLSRRLVGTPIIIDFCFLPLGALPVGALPLGTLPLGTLPLGTLPFGTLPLDTLPLGAFVFVCVCNFKTINLPIIFISNYSTNFIICQDRTTKKRALSVLF